MTSRSNAERWESRAAAPDEAEEVEEEEEEAESESDSEDLTPEDIQSRFRDMAAKQGPRCSGGKRTAE